MPETPSIPVAVAAPVTSTVSTSSSPVTATADSSVDSPGTLPVGSSGHGPAVIIDISSAAVSQSYGDNTTTLSNAIRISKQQMNLAVSQENYIYHNDGKVNHAFTEEFNQLEAQKMSLVSGGAALYASAGALGGIPNINNKDAIEAAKVALMKSQLELESQLNVTVI